MKQSLELRASQQLTMTPQLQQAIRLLQLPAAELSLEIRDALESNVMLEPDEETDASATEEPPEAPSTSSLDPSEAVLGSNATDATGFGEGIAVADHWDEPGGSDDSLDRHASPSASLRDHLQWQVDLSSLGERDRRIAAALIDALDERGHLTEPVVELLETLGDNGDIDEDDVNAVLTILQHMDPVGVAAPDVRQALRIQIDAMPAETPCREVARRAIDADWKLFSPGQQSTLRDRLGVDQATLDEALRLIRQLDPHPGSRFGETRTEYVIPDCRVRRIHGRWEVEINPEATPRIRINDYYASLVRRGDGGHDNNLLREHLQEARWLIKSLQSRGETLQRVAECIVARQQGFLEYGEEAMQPLVLRDVAEAIEMHESTVSRITSRKYMLTPQGTLEFKHFFSSHVPTADGGECSATAIRARIRRQVAAENPARPLSDSRLTDILRDEGIHVARRTVAKYREVMGIASSTERKRPC
ncbi:RNA polymerase factor sigma-54 [Spiribacter vilamensis]|uniref:RNA polymerase sigma-54 factor n=2 Tax=Spiribacter vilamensis TaxID=531306 RepID=A0A4Q8CY51_9GAMM|nr:RNA polymerase factor sigma-54 [Spiribacter vilamensis]RZU97881.1 RNA polymerase RpoN-/SigL-like sigma 54 subunit [Spiribacter vilamensis]TVO61202.1 RNA polymerase factor sigma-54 [Spiribacter vilamensis]